MKHKRQTLTKQGEDGDDKDSTASEGGKSGKMSDKFLDDDMSKKSCQGCEMPTGVGCGPHDDPPDIGSTRGNNNNTPSATNNNTSFNSNSNGASSVASSGSFDKMMAEDDSRSNEDSGVHTSPRTSSKKSIGSITVKVEGKKSSPNSERQIGMCKPSPGSQKENCGNGQGLLMALSDGIASGSKSLSSRSLTPSSTPGTPMQHQSPIGPPGMPMYPPTRSSPTTATAIASATVTIQNVANAVPPFVPRGTAAVSNFQNQYPISGTNDYPPGTQRTSKHMQYQMHHQQNYNSDVYTSDHQQHVLSNHQNMMMGARANEINQRGSSRGHVRQNYHHQQPYHNQHYYNYNKNHHNSSTEGSYHNVNQGYNHNYGYNNHYSYHHGMYSSENTPDNMINNHMNQQDPSNYYSNDNIQHPIHKNQNHVDYPTKNNTHENYYENNMYNHLSQTNHETYPENFQQSSTVQNTPTAIAATSAAVMTPPTSVQTDNNDTYSNFHQFYNQDTPQAQAPPPQTSGDNSNSSADFNFLSNLANDFAPEYYQLS